MKNLYPPNKHRVFCSLLLFSLSLPLRVHGTEKTVEDFRAAAAKGNAVLTIPQWEQTPEAVETSMKDAIAKAKTAINKAKNAGYRGADAR